MVYTTNNSIGASSIDSKLPPLFPITGIIDDNKFNDVISILCQSFYSFNNIKHNKQDIKKNIQFIHTFTKKSNLGIVKNRKTGKIYVNKKIRKSYQKTFGNNIVNRLKPTIQSIVQKSINSKNISCRIEQSHGDIILYKRGDYFNLHRDERLKYRTDYEMFTFILCISSNISKYCMEDNGNTIVYLPASTNIKKNIDTKELVKHSYPQSRMSKHWLLFPSQALHAGSKILGKNKYKLCMKLDVWIKFNKHYIMYKNIHYVDTCQCLLCNNYIKLQIINKALNKIPTDIIKIVYDMLHKRRDACYCNYKNKNNTEIDYTNYKDCICTCNKCMNNSSNLNTNFNRCDYQYQYIDIQIQYRVQKRKTLEYANDYDDNYCNGSYDYDY